MRDIEFRGQRTDNKEWVYGYLSMHTIKEYNEGLKHYPHISFIDKELGFYVGVNVIPETVGQYTGLTDKNGTRIFEGDILRYNNEENVEVKYQPSEFVLIFKSQIYPQCGLLTDNNIDKIEAISNIHGNPELLKGGSEDGV